MFTQDRSELRARFTAAWAKARDHQPLDPEEQQLVEIMHEHPEYQQTITDDDEVMHRDYREEGEVNPFLHIGLHLALLEQVRKDRPAGIRRVYRQVLDAYGSDRHDAEHAMMSCLADTIWRVVRGGQRFNEKAYLRCLRQCKDVV
jgi:DnaJ-domain-containing protein 1